MKLVYVIYFLFLSIVIFAGGTVLPNTDICDSSVAMMAPDPPPSPPDNPNPPPPPPPDNPALT